MVAQKSCPELINRKPYETFLAGPVDQGGAMAFAMPAGSRCGAQLLVHRLIAAVGLHADHPDDLPPPAHEFGEVAYLRLRQGPG